MGTLNSSDQRPKLVLNESKLVESTVSIGAPTNSPHRKMEHALIKKPPHTISRLMALRDLQFSGWEKKSDEDSKIRQGDFWTTVALGAVSILHEPSKGLAFEIRAFSQVLHQV